MKRPTLRTLMAAGLTAGTLTMSQPAHAQQPFDPEARLRELGITLPTPDAPIANYVKAVRTGNLVFLAGHGPCGPRDERTLGKVGRDRTLEDGYYAARMTGICLLASLKQEIGDLKNVVRIVKVLGMV
ncbi:MAG TPA: RidA family protein, partial [Gemmatimonadales bacterium]|nr:RidA family protein [Gemmatimonadales bacterium]